MSSKNHIAISDLDPKLERSFRGHKGTVNGVAFNPNMKQVASAGNDHVVMVWNFKSQLRAFRYFGHRGPVTDVEYSPRGDTLVSASTDSTVRLWEPNVHGRSVVLRAHSAAVRSASFSSDGKFLITGSDDKSAKVWNLVGHRFKCTLSGHSNWVRAARFSPDVRLAVTGSDDKTVRLWDLHAQECLHKFHEHTGGVNDVAFHPFGTVIASASSDNSIKLWDIRSNHLLQHYAAHEAPVTSISFHPSGDFLISSSEDGSVKVWDVREGQQLYTVHSHKRPIKSTRFSPNGAYFASGGADQLVMTWRSNFDALLGVDMTKLTGSTDFLRSGKRGSQLVPSNRSDTSRSSESKQAGGGSDRLYGRGVMRHDRFSTQPVKPRPRVRPTAQLKSVEQKSGGGAEDKVHPGLPNALSVPPQYGKSSCTYVHEHREASGKFSHAYAGPCAAAPEDVVQEDEKQQTSSGTGPRVFSMKPASNGTSKASSKRTSGAPGGTVALVAQRNQTARLPEELSLTLARMVDQLDVITKTLSAFDERLAILEDKDMQNSSQAQ